MMRNCASGNPSWHCLRGTMDSGPAPVGASRNDEGERGAKLRTSSPEIQPPVRKAPVDARGIDHEPDPRPHDSRVRQIDVFADEPTRAVARRIDQSMPSAIVPIEPQIDPIARDPELAAALLPFVRRIAGNGRIGAAVPAARPGAFEWIR